MLNHLRISLYILRLKNLSLRNDVLAMKHKNKKQRRRKGKTMLGTFSNKLDKNMSIISLTIISLVTLYIASGLFNVFNISGVFKQ